MDVCKDVHASVCSDVIPMHLSTNYQLVGIKQALQNVGGRLLNMAVNNTGCQIFEKLNK